MGAVPCCVARSTELQTPRTPRHPGGAPNGGLSARQSKVAGSDTQACVRLELVPPPCSPGDGPQPSEIADFVREWISQANVDRAIGATSLELVEDEEVEGHMREHRKQNRKRPVGEDNERLEKHSEGMRYLFGALCVTDADGCRKTFDVGVQLKRFLTPKQRCIILHFFETQEEGATGQKLSTLVADRGRKQVAMAYCEAATGAFHGIHIAEEHRGCGLMKPAFLYYVLFCREFGLPTTHTAVNKKPLFANLFKQMGYQPCCVDFPFLLFTKAADQDPKVERPSTAREFRPQAGSTTYVMPLAASKGRPEDARFLREGKQVESSWTFSLNFAMSQGLQVVNDATTSQVETAESDGATRLYAKTAWSLPNASDRAHREAALEELLRRRATAVMYSDAVTHFCIATPTLKEKFPEEQHFFIDTCRQTIPEHCPMEAGPSSPAPLLAF